MENLVTDSTEILIPLKTSSNILIAFPAPNGRALSPRAPRFAAGLFTEVGGDVVAFGVEESTYRFLAPAT